MKRYPVIFVFLCYIIGILLATEIKFEFDLFHLIALVAGLLLLAILLHRLQFLPTFIIGFTVVACGFAAQTCAFKQLEIKLLKSTPNFAQIRLTGFVASDIHLKNSQYRFDFSIQAVELDGEWTSESGIVRVTSKSIPDSLSFGSKVFLQGNWVRPKAPRFPGGFDYRVYLQAKGISGLVKVRKDGALVSLQQRDSKAGVIPVFMAQAREKVWQSLKIITDAQAAPILRGLLIGDRNLIDMEIIDTFSQIGIIHVLAISGLHVGFVVLLAYALGALFQMKRLYKDIFALMIVWGFGLFTGLQTPVFRAAVMFSFYTIARIRDRSMHNFSLLALAGLVILAVNPMEIFMVGFHLSFSAVAGILYFYPKLERLVLRTHLGRFIWDFDILQSIANRYKSHPKLHQLFISRTYSLKVLKFFPALFLVTLAAQLGTAPVMLLHFGRFSFVGFLANLIVIPGVMITVFLAVPILLLFMISPFAAAFAGNLIDQIVGLLLQSSFFLASFSWANIENYYPQSVQVISVFIAFIGFIEWSRKRIRFAAFMSVFFLLNWNIWTKVLDEKRQCVKITMLDVGQGDATLLQFPGNKAMLIDAGPFFPEYDPGKEIILPYLLRQGIRKLDIIVITHPHLDHFGGFLSLVENIPIQRAVFADTSYHDKNFQKLVHDLQANGTEIQIVQRGDILTLFNPAIIYVMGPAPEKAKIDRNWNDASLVLRLRYGNSAALFTGDTESAGEFELQKYGDFLVSNLLKAGHHGSRTSSEPSFLQMVKPHWVTISAGAFNKFGHPAQESIDNYTELNVAIARTDNDGALQFATDGRTLWRLID
ncbi:MAG: DNA internalization-related competence protein ComEC/Rec2 [Deferribacteres bacterium]|nr:DNA internalization-related competence protein ComEC/Rec2 [candidate division KSB1 bacterium]MCB9502525.1 DNA internalization-related competence protein ComEC/Rec2 [Deferribacteres bacterium]